MANYILKDDAEQFICEVCELPSCPRLYGNDCEVLCRLNKIPAADVLTIPDGGIGEVSDGYHTFNGLYYQRMILFAALVKAYKDKAWKSWKHEDGKPCFGGGWFIVGIDTPQGSYTYHYENKYWSWFECEELPVAKHWDGHTEKDVTRLLSLHAQPIVYGKWEYISSMTVRCSNCQEIFHELEENNFCPNCGVCMIENKED